MIYEEGIIRPTSQPSEPYNTNVTVRVSNLRSSGWLHSLAPLFPQGAHCVHQDVITLFCDLRSKVIVKLQLTTSICCVVISNSGQFDKLLGLCIHRRHFPCRGRERQEAGICAFHHCQYLNRADHLLLSRLPPHLYDWSILTSPVRGLDTRCVRLNFAYGASRGAIDLF